MRGKSNRISSIKKAASKKKQRGASHDYETMSQQQNRYGHGRQQNGSDGSDDRPQGNNH